MRLICSIVVTCCFVFLSPLALSAEDPHPKGIATEIEGVPVHASHELDSNGDTYPGVRRVIGVFHGTKRDHIKYYRRFYKALKKQRGLNDTAIFAILFPMKSDKKRIKNGHYWKNASWKRGDVSEDRARRLAFDVADAVIEKMVKTHFPNAQSVKLVGHSAGSQFLQRYSAMNNLSGRGVNETVQFYLFNPSSYMWPDGNRPHQTGKTCHEMNSYKYGLEPFSLVPNPAQKTRDEALTDLISSCTVVAAGRKDTRVDRNLDTTCAANAQGPNRLERARSYTHAMHDYVDSLGNATLQAAFANRFLAHTSVQGEFNAKFDGPAPKCSHSSSCMFKKMIEVIDTGSCNMNIPNPQPVNPWHNSGNPYDVNDDGHVVPLDVLLIINEINKNGAHALPTIATTPPIYYDVDNDWQVTRTDAQLIIDYLNSQ